MLRRDWPDRSDELTHRLASISARIRTRELLRAVAIALPCAAILAILLRQTGMSPNTVESYARDLTALAAFAEARKTGVEQFGRRDLEAFVRRLMTQGLSPRSVARTVACVRGFYRFLALERKLDESPAADLKAPRAWPALPKFLDLDEVDRLLAQPDVSTPRGIRDKSLIEVLYASGLRVSELVSIKPGDLHLDEGYLTCVGKGDKERIVPVGDEATAWLRRYMLVCGCACSSNRWRRPTRRLPADRR